MKLRVVTLLAGMACAPLFLNAQAADRNATAAKPPASQESPDDLVCTYEQVTGSHLGHRVCMTRKQREARAREDQEALRNLQRSGTSSSSTPGVQGH